MFNDTIPGTNITYSKDALKKIKELIDVAGGLSLSQVCTITSLHTSTIQNWVKRGYIPRPENKKYFERHMARILLVSALRDSMNIEDMESMFYFCSSLTSINFNNLDTSLVTNMANMCF